MNCKMFQWEKEHLVGVSYGTEYVPTQQLKPLNLRIYNTTVITITQILLTSLAPSLHREFSKLRLNAKRELEMSTMFGLQ